MKKLLIGLSLVPILFLLYIQYTFNARVEWWAANRTLTTECEQYETIVPMKITLDEKFGTYKNGKYAQSLKIWKQNVLNSEIEACTKAHDWYSMNPEMPFTEKWYQDRKEAGLLSIYGYIKDLFNKPYEVEGKTFDKVSPSLILKDPWYGGGDGACFVTARSEIGGLPLPFLHRYIYVLDCKNDKTRKEGIGGFIAVTTSNHLTPIRK